VPELRSAELHTYDKRALPYRPRCAACPAAYAGGQREGLGIGSAPVRSSGRILQTSAPLMFLDLKAEGSIPGWPSRVRPCFQPISAGARTAPFGRGRSFKDGSVRRALIVIYRAGGACVLPRGRSRFSKNFAGGRR